MPSLCVKNRHGAALIEVQINVVLAWEVHEPGEDRVAPKIRQLVPGVLASLSSKASLRSRSVFPLRVRPPVSHKMREALLASTSYVYTPWMVPEYD